MGWKGWLEWVGYRGRVRHSTMDTNRLFIFRNAFRHNFDSSIAYTLVSPPLILPCDEVLPLDSCVNFKQHLKYFCLSVLFYIFYLPAHLAPLPLAPCPDWQTSVSVIIIILSLICLTGHTASPLPVMSCPVPPRHYCRLPPKSGVICGLLFVVFIVFVAHSLCPQSGSQSIELYGFLPQ